MSTQKIGLSSIDSSEFLMGNKNQQNNSNIVKNKEENKEKEILKILEKNNMPQRHSYFQLRYFVVGKEPTNQAKMWQCLREIRARKSSLDSIELEYEEQKDNLEMLEIEEKTIEINKNKTENKELFNLIEKENEIKKRKITRKKKSIIGNMAELLNKKKYIKEELDFFLEMFKAIEKTEPLKSLDDVESQKNYWSEKLTQKLNLKLLSGSAIDNELIETIVSLPDDMAIKKQVINTLTLRQEQIIKKIEENKGKINGN